MKIPYPLKKTPSAVFPSGRGLSPSSLTACAVSAAAQRKYTTPRRRTTAAYIRIMITVSMPAIASVPPSEKSISVFPSSVLAER